MVSESRMPTNTEDQFRILVQAISDYAIYMLDPDGHVTSWNPGAERAKGYAEAEIIGEYYGKFFTQADRAAGRPAQELALARDLGRYEDEGWRVRKDGTQFWALVVLVPIRANDGTVIGFAKVTRDITERRALEEAKEQLSRTQKIESIGHLTGGVAHDFNNLLSALMGSLELITLYPNDSARVLRLSDIALRAVRRGAKITAQLLSFARRQVLYPQPTNINDAIIAFEPLLRQAAGDRVAFSLRLTEPDLHTNIDPAHLQSALLNLVINARDAMPHGGAMAIETRQLVVEHDDLAAIQELRPGAYIAITVRDSGHGMTEDVKARALEPFFTTKDIGDGSGLGLSQAYGFACQSNGHLDIESEIGIGTAVNLYLPVSDRPAVDEPIEQAAMRLGNKGCILVVEDDPEVLEIATTAIRSFGYQVHCAVDGHEALIVLQRHGAIDLLFTDVVMPQGMNGVELAARACQLRPELRVLMASGHPRTALSAHDGLDDSFEFIAKPYTLAALNERLQALMV